MKSTLDSLWQGRLHFRQPARGEGYRFNLDPVLLAGFVAPAKHMIELGAGCGVLSVLLVRMGKAERLTAIELQPTLCGYLRENVARNTPGHVDVMEGALQTVTANVADAVVFNPPYVRRGAGRLPKDPGNELARCEVAATLADFVGAAVRLLRAEGWLGAIVPAGRWEEFRQLCVQHGFRALRRRWVVARAADTPGRCLVAAQRGAECLADEPPLIVHAGPGRQFSPEVQRWVDGP